MAIKNFIILPSGAVKGGTFAYEYNPETEKLTYSLHAHAQAFLFKKDFDEAGAQKLPKEKLLSKAYSKIGAKVEFANLKGQVTEVHGHLVKAKLEVVGLNAGGEAVFDLSGTYASLVELNAEGSFGPLTFNIILHPA